MTKPLIVKNLTKTYGSLVALDALNLELEPGEIFGLLGPNGAGKTTLISMLTGLLSPTSGNASVFGFDVFKQRTDACRLIGVVPQEIISHGFFTINQVLNFHSGYYGLKSNQKHIDYLLDSLALSDHRNKLVSQLSGGMKRRLLIAKSLVHSPKLLLLDEPTAGVDVELRTTLWKFVRELNRQGVTILLTTHYLEEAEELCGRIGVLNLGKKIAMDQTKNLIQQLTQRHLTLHLTGPISSNNLPDGVEIKGNTMTAKISHQESLGSFIQRLNIPMESINDLSVTEGRLEDAFVALLSQQNTTA